MHVTYIIQIEIIKYNSFEKHKKCKLLFPRNRKYVRKISPAFSSDNERSWVARSLPTETTFLSVVTNIRRPYLPC